MDEKKIYRVFLSAAEHSGDMHCAGLIEKLKGSGAEFEFSGVGGNRMAEAGCRLLKNTTEKTTMLYHAVAEAPKFYMLIRRIRKYFEENKIDLVVVCDSPAFNWHVAKAAKLAGVKVLYYVAPQLWAWGGWRIDKMRKYCDKLCCILPFEQAWFSERGIDAEFVGNPLMDDVGDYIGGNEHRYSGFDPEKAHIVLMPGSRKAEISSLWPSMQEIAVELRRRLGQVQFTTVAVDEQVRDQLKSSQILNFRCKYNISNVYETAKGADFVLVASGSASLQVAAAGCPMIVMYQSSKLVWKLLGRWLVKIRLFSLANILAGRELVPEFMPYFESTEPISKKAYDLLTSPGRLSRMSRDLVRITEPLQQDAAGNTARVVLEMVGAKKAENKPEKKGSEKVKDDHPTLF